MYDVLIIGGGLAGLTASILLKKGGMNVALLEKKEYPFHRVCGEYVSNEVIPFLKKNDLWPAELKPVPIDTFHLSDTKGKLLSMPLDLGGFGVSRYSLDNFFVQNALNLGADIHTNTRAENITFHDDLLTVTTREKKFTARVVIGAFGKRSHLDKQLNRPFIGRRSPYIGVKYHIKNAPHADNTVALHNFSGGYCGINAIEDGTYNLCYLSHRDNLKQFLDIKTMEEKVLCQNPILEEVFNKSTFLWDAPLVINEISFETKEPVIGHILTCGDAAGMITPLCGNGMAMAIHSGKILSESILKHCYKKDFDRNALEIDYARTWNKQFSFRLSAGRQIQRLFGNSHISNLAVSVGRHSSPVAKYLMSKTHGDPFV
jgi:menaquinone-9 beta-reductase